jgi:hypothetical protein
MANEGNPDDGGLRLPTGVVPDPTLRTTQQVLRENFWLRELLETRLTGMDKALSLLQAFADRTPTTMDVQHEVAQLREVMTVRFASVDATFTQKETALQAAFAAQEKQAIATNTSNAAANSKMEDSFTKQIDSLYTTKNADTKGIDDKIDDIKSRLTIIESKTSISDPSTAITLAKLDATVARLTSSTDIGAGRAAGQTALWALIVGGLGLVIGVASAIGLLMKVMH